MPLLYDLILHKPLTCAGVNAQPAANAGKHLILSLDTVLTFHLYAENGGTRLEVNHAGYKGFRMVLVSFIMGMGWKKQMKKLKVLLATMK